MTGVLARAKPAVAYRLVSHRNAIMWRPRADHGQKPRAREGETR